MRVLGWIRVGFKSWRVQGNEGGGLLDEVVGVEKGSMVDDPEFLVAGVMTEVPTVEEDSLEGAVAPQADKSTTVEVDAGARLDSWKKIDMLLLPLKPGVTAVDWGVFGVEVVGASALNRGKWRMGPTFRISA